METALTSQLGRTPRGQHRQQWEPLGWGAWWKPPSSPQPPQPPTSNTWDLARARFNAQIITVMQRCPSGSTLDGIAAAHWWGLPISGQYGQIDILTGVHHSRHRGERRGKTTVKIVPSSRYLPPEAITTHRGVQVIKPIYLCVELLIRLPLRKALPIVEAAIAKMLKPNPLFRQYVSEEFDLVIAQFRQILQQRRWRRGITKATTALKFISPWSQSVGETLTKLLIHQAQLPTPQQQLPVPSGNFWIWPDFAWPNKGVVVEFDGLEKYRGRERQALREEKLREEHLRKHFPYIYQILWEDLHNGNALRLLQHIRRKFFAKSTQPAPTTRPKPPLTKPTRI